MRILLVPNTDNPQAVDGAYMLSAWLMSQDIETVMVGRDILMGSGTSNDDSDDGIRIESTDDFNLAIALGGDGTILRCARLIGYAEVPILGLNFGHLGFLSGGSREGIIETVATALAGEARVERRTTLRVETVFPTGRSEFHFALNEVAIARGSSGRVIDFGLFVNGTKIARMRGDGVLVATATGSTGYALSAGGPVVAPGFTGLIVVPIAPHTLNSRAIVTDPSDVVEIDLTEKPLSEACIFVDGNVLECEVPDHVIVSRGEGDILLLKHTEQGFYRSVSGVFFAGSGGGGDAR